MKSTNQQNTVNQYLAALDQPNFWRLFVDGYKQDTQADTLVERTTLSEADYGHLFWAAREPNGLNSLRQTAKKLFSNQLNDELTFEFIKEVHYSAYPFQDNLIINPDYMLQQATLNFGNRHNTYKQFIWAKNRALALKKQFKFKYKPWEIKRDFEDGGLAISTSLSHEQKIAYYNKLVEQYNQNISDENKSDDEKLKIIIQFIQDGECLHIFRDGNTRRSYLEFNKELIKHGFEPVILANPNDICWKTNEQLVIEVKKGQKAYKNFIETGLPYETCVEDAQIAENIKNIDFKVISEILASTSYKKCLNLIEKIKTSYKEFYNYHKTHFTLGVNNEDSSSETDEEMEETSEEFEDTPSKICGELKKIWENYKEFLAVQAQIEDRGEILDIERYHDKSIEDSLTDLLKFDTYYAPRYKTLKLLFDQFASLDKIYDNGFLQNKDAGFEEIFADIDSYFEKLQLLCQRYEDIDASSLANPLLCHLTKTEQKDLEEKLKQDELSSSLDEFLDLSDEILETSTDVEVSGITLEEII